MTAPEATITAYCHRCDAETLTHYIPLGNDIGNCCSICRTCRKGRPYIKKLEYAQTLKLHRADGKK